MSDMDDIVKEFLVESYENLDQLDHDKEKLRQMIEFRQVNLAGTWPPLFPMDIVLMRNVMIYLPEPCHPSLPTVIKGNSYTLRVPGSCLVSQVTFECEGYPLLAILLERDESQVQQQ